MPNDPEVDSEIQTPEEHYNANPSRIRSLVYVLMAYWEMHPERTLVDVVLRIAADVHHSVALEDLLRVRDHEFSDKLTEFMNGEMRRKLGLPDAEDCDADPS